MLAKRLELKNISPCRVPKPNVPENIKKECETYIAFWDQKIYEENKNNILNQIIQKMMIQLKLSLKLLNTLLQSKKLKHMKTLI